MLAACTSRGSRDGMRFAAGRSAKSGEQRFDRGLRGHFAVFVAADAIGQREQPAVRARLVRMSAAT